MNSSRIIITLVLAVFCVMPAYSQTQTKRRSPQLTRGKRIEKVEDSAFPNLSERAKAYNERLNQEMGNARWMRVIYRDVDLTQEKNSPLYYPTRPMNDMQNLFSIIFNLVSEKKIKVYEYLDGYEVFDEAHEVQFKDLLDRFYILYDSIPSETKNKTAYVVNESDIPTEEVKNYYVKEAWYFDQNNSCFDRKILAICPILSTDGDIGAARMPMFWVPYDNIRPYINAAYIMTSNRNNAKIYTLDDYFSECMYKGDIIKTQNLMNQPLQTYCPTPDSLKHEQQRIEQQLSSFEQTLWMQPDTTSVNENSSTNQKKTLTIKKTPKVKKVKTPKQTNSSSVVKSVRRRR